jgi:tetratricopeptide (TPR) repeat protein
MLWISWPSGLAAANPEELFAEANQAFSRGDFAEAAELYQSIVTTEGYSAPLLYNLANSLAHGGERGKAILNYERAALLAPVNADIQGNLDKLRKESGLYAEQPVGLEWLVSLLSLDQWTLVAFAGLILLCATALIALWRKPARVVAFPILAISSVFLLVGISAATISAKSFNPAIVLSSEARLLLSPFPEASSLGTIQEGRKVFILREYQDYAYVRDRSGRKGWLPEAAIEQLIVQ